MITKQDIARTMDHSILGTYCSKESIEQACREAVEYGFASLYVTPSFVKRVKELVGDKCAVGVAIGFPWGTHTTATKIFESLEAIDNGATELDIVINVSKLKAGDTDYVYNELSEWVKACKGKNPNVICKAIIECFYLTHEEKIKAVDIVARSGCDYVKQATGMTPNSSYTYGDVLIMKKVAAGRCKIKASGWLMNVEDCIACLEAGCERVGNDHGPQWIDKDYDNNRYYK